MARILLIEDDPVFRTIMRHVLTRENHSVSEADNGQIGTARLVREKFDLVITDILMPEMDGLEVIQTVRRLQPATRILAISGGGRNPAGFYLTMAAKLGAHKTLSKPFSPGELMAAVSKLVSESSPDQAG